MLIQELHTKNHYVSANHTLTQLRERFWIIKGRAKVKSVKHRCVVCRRWEGGSYQLPPMSPMSVQRVEEASPFQMIGLDYLGPIMVLDNKNSTPMYVALFVCLVTRAVHLELARDLSADEFIMALDRFCSSSKSEGNYLDFRTCTYVGRKNLQF